MTRLTAYIKIIYLCLIIIIYIKDNMKPITYIAQKLGIDRKYLELYGDYKA